MSNQIEAKLAARYWLGEEPDLFLAARVLSSQGATLVVYAVYRDEDSDAIMLAVAATAYIYGELLVNQCFMSTMGGFEEDIASCWPHAVVAQADVFTPGAFPKWQDIVKAKEETFYLHPPLAKWLFLPQGRDGAVITRIQRQPTIHMPTEAESGSGVEKE